MSITLTTENSARILKCPGAIGALERDRRNWHTKAGEPCALVPGCNLFFQEADGETTLEPTIETSEVSSISEIPCLAES